MTPARDRLARILMITLGIASVGAFATPALTFDTFPPERVNIETWRMFGYLVFAGLFTLLGLFPRRMTGIWELVLFHKAGVAIFLAYFVKADAAANVTFVDSTNNIILVDAVLAGVTFFSYLLTNGWRAWMAPRGDFGMTGLTVILGYGAAGRATAQALAGRGDEICVAQRSRPADLPANASFRSCDVLDAQSVREAIEGASQVVLAVGFPYDARVWRTAWPKTITNVVEACAETKARVVFVDNLYMLGPQRTPRREDMPLTKRGEKPAILSEVTRIWMAAAKAGRVRIASLRCTDFYGPGVPVSHLGAQAFGALAQGKPALFIVPPDIRHDFAYVPDIARAVVTLLDAPDDAFGQVWNMPCAPTRTAREILRLGAAAIGVKPKLRAIPLWLLPLLGLFVRFMREVADVGFTWDRPYVVDATKFTRRFWSDITPFEIGAPATARSFLPATTASAPSR